MGEAVLEAPPRSSRNIVIFSDGTGQRGGVYFDEARTNVYKLYRATRVCPDSCIDPNRQLAFYDPGLGTLRGEGTTLGRLYRYVYNFISQATGLGITRNIIDCYAALIRLWQPGDRIFLFGFSRGAYTVRCLASVICYCGIPTREKGGGVLRRDAGSTTKLAARAVKSVYQHVSSPRDQKYFAQRLDLAQKFREEHDSGAAAGALEPNVYPHFIGVFDTVAALSNTGSLAILAITYLLLHVVVACGLKLFANQSFEYWFGWSVVWTLGAVGAAYVYTHLKFAFGLKRFFFWDVIHLTSLRQKFYDQMLNSKVRRACHAISLDERRHDFQRVKWQRREGDIPPTERIGGFQQIWFAGNHADIGGGYPEHESRLSDLALQWMIEQAEYSELADEGLLVDASVLKLHGCADGLQHDEVQSSLFRFAKKTIRDADKSAIVHNSVISRFELPEVQQYDVKAPYRPEALRRNDHFSTHYADIPLPRRTAWQCLQQVLEITTKRVVSTLNATAGSALERIYPANWTGDQTMQKERVLTPDSVLSFVALSGLVLLNGYAAYILFGWQVLPWLYEAQWHSCPLSAYWEPQVAWKGAQKLINGAFNLPATLVFAVLGFVQFYVLGGVSTWMYKTAARNAGQRPTPSQTHA